MKANTTKIDACYCRYSSDKQRDTTSIEVQIEQCERSAGKLLVVYQDEAKTGRALAGREQLHRLMIDASEGKISNLYVLRYDRLGRNEADTFTTVAELEDYGVQVISAQEGREVITRGIHLVMAAHYSRDLSIKTKNGLLKRHEQRTFTGGKAPVGYRVIDRDDRRVLEIDPDESKSVRFIFDSYTDPTQPMGFKIIAKTLNDRGIPTRSMIDEQNGRAKVNRRINRTRKATPWSKSSIRCVLTNPIYTGMVVFNRRTMKLDRETGRRVPRFNDPSVHQSYQTPDLRIINDEQFQAAQGKLKARVKPRGSARSASLIRAFTGHLFCEDCGSAFYSRQSANKKGVYIYYQCGCRQRRGPEACPNEITLREDHLIKSLQQVCAVAFDDIEGMVEEATAEARRATDDNREQAARIRKQIAETEMDGNGLTALLRDPEMDEMARTVIRRQLSDVGTKLATTQAALDRLLDKSNDDADALIVRVREKLLAARQRWESVANSAQLNSLIGELVGPSIVSADGRLLPVGATKDPVHAADATVHGVIAGEGFEPSTSGYEGDRSKR
jgi:site-specific DNA recombinase